MPHPRRTLGLEQWPEVDQCAWARAFGSNDPLDDARAAHWRPSTRRTVQVHYGLWLAWLFHSDRLDPAAAPAERADRDNLLAYLSDLRERGSSTITIYNHFRDLREALRVMQPDADIAALTQLLPRLEAVAEPARVKAELIVSPARLLDRAIDEMTRLQTMQDLRSSRRTAERFRDALMLALLASRPLRLSNFTNLTLGRSVLKPADPSEPYRCSFKPRDMKDHQALDFPLPHFLTPWLDRYLDDHRPLLLRGSKSERLWISIRATPMQANSIYYRVRHVTDSLVGTRINPHLIRDCVATFIAEVAPKEIRIVARILGHETLATSEKFYNQASALSAQSRHLEAIERIRQEGSDDAGQRFR